MAGQRRKRPKRQAEHDGEQHCHSAQFQRDREEVDDDVIDVLRAVTIGGPKIAVERAEEIFDILRGQRLVEVDTWRRASP